MKGESHLRKIFAVGILVLLVSLPLALWMLENWRGAKAWEVAEAAAEKEGLVLTRAGLMVDIPDEENLLKDPLFLREVINVEPEDRLTSWRKLPIVEKNKWIWLKPAEGKSTEYRSLFAEDLSEEQAREKLGRAAADFSHRLEKLAEVILAKPDHPVFLNERVKRSVFDVELVGCIEMDLLKCYHSSVLMALRSGDQKTAIQGVEVIAKLTRLREKESLSGNLIAQTYFGMVKNLTWEGIRIRAWQGADLEDLAEILEQQDSIKNLKQGLRFNLAYMLDLLTEVRGAREGGSLGKNMEEARGFRGWLSYGGPREWHHRRKAYVVIRYLEMIDQWDPNDPFHEQPSPRDREVVGAWSPLTHLAEALGHTPDLIKRLYQSGGTRRNIALLAIRLELYFQQHQRYPVDLAELGADRSFKDLTDPEKKQLQYRLGRDGRPEIWSAYEMTLERKFGPVLRWQYWSEDPSDHGLRGEIK